MAEETQPDSGLPPGDAAADRPTKVGPYHVLDVLGEGGMGTVYLAEQRQPVRRRVALKVIKLGMDTKSVLARFDAERQALSMMEHTNIARVFECGATEKGQPWFAMEHVKGIPITDYCDQNKLSLSERIGLFKKVCAAVQHAHLKGVMHRDLKPSNVLVMLQDDTAIPKVIDFGLAKAVDHRLVEATLFTEQGVVLGTPEYMSPEQAGLGGLDIDTRTDVYSLGVLLYELLTGDLPFRRNDLRSRGLLEMQRVIRETDPPKPSTRVTTMGVAAEEAAKLRGLDAAELGKSLRGDLDWILMRALEKDPTRRYQSVSELSSDLGRYLKFEPVLASPPQFRYRVRKFVRRYRLQVAAASLVVGALIAGAIATWVQYRRAEGALVVANQRAEEAERARINAEQARKEAEEAKTLALARQGEATNLAEEARREKERAEAERKNADAQSAIARRAEQEANDRAAEAQQQKERVEALNKQLEPWRLSVAGPAQLAAASARAETLDPHQMEPLQHWLAREAAPLREMLPKVREALAQLRGRARTDSTLENGVPRTIYRLPEADDQKLHDTLSDLVGRIETFEREQVVRIQSWLAVARRWTAAREALAKADGIVASELYGARYCPEHPIDLRPQADLMPIGMNPRTGLWEFSHLPSAATPAGQTDARALPQHTAERDGWLPPGTRDGIVFVLIPGGTFLMGAQPQWQRDPNHDPLATEDEQPVSTVALAPFLLARHEITQAQWERLAKQAARPSRHAAGTGLHPVENVNWQTAVAVLHEHGLVLPTEAQWEYACRAGTSSPWSCASDALQHHANLADQTARQAGEKWNAESWSDGHVVHAPVASFQPNDFGLHDMHGNVWEWCLDEYGKYGTPVAPRTGQRLRGNGKGEHVRRGGGFGSSAEWARSAARAASNEASDLIGIRPARTLTPN